MIINAYITKDNDVYIDGEKLIQYSHLHNESMFGLQINNTDKDEIELITELSCSIVCKLKQLKEILK